MPVPQELTDALTAVDTETNNVATVIDALRAKINTSMTPEDVAVVTGTLGDLSSRLKSIAADPNNPNPVPPGPTPVMRKK